MRNILIILIISLIFSSCKKIEDLNKNIKDPSKVSGESLFTGAQKNLFDQMITPNVNNNVWRMFVQHWTETSYTDESNYDIVTRPIPENHWTALYRDVLKNFLEAKNAITAMDDPLIPAAVKKNKLAIIEIMSVYTWSILVESFGNIPYTEALNINTLNPKYDDAVTVYKDLLTRLNAAIANIDNTVDVEMGDNMYGGVATQWLMFANSLKLKMGIMLSDYDNTLAQTTVEAAVTAGVFVSNVDNARIIYLNGAPNSNKIYDNLVASGRHDFVIANTFATKLNDLNDPRMSSYFSNPITFKYRYVDDIAQDSVVTTGMGTVFIYADSVVYKQPPYTIYAADTLNVPSYYYGAIYGANSKYSRFSHVSAQIQLPTFEGLILDYSEVEFYLAEAKARGYAVSGTEESHYNEAITASIAYWGGSVGDATAYLANPKVKYSDPISGATWKEKIGMQKWIALYNRGFEAWTEWRRLDYPVLVAPENAKSKIPLRLTYPVVEQTLNGSNYQSASSAIGGDLVTTPLFWDKYLQTGYK